MNLWVWYGMGLFVDRKHTHTHTHTHLHTYTNNNLEINLFSLEYLYNSLYQLFKVYVNKLQSIFFLSANIVSSAGAFYAWYQCVLSSVMLGSGEGFHHYSFSTHFFLLSLVIERLVENWHVGFWQIFGSYWTFTQLKLNGLNSSLLLLARRLETQV